MLQFLNRVPETVVPLPHGAKQRDHGVLGVVKVAEQDLD
jgi:hypothetical protein